MTSRAAAAVVTALEALGVSLRVEGGQLAYDWAGPMSEDAPAVTALEARFESLIAELRTCKAGALDLIDARATGRPYLIDDCLVIPFTAPRRYHWWLTDSDTCDLHAVLVELRAGLQLHHAYCGIECELDGSGAGEQKSPLAPSVADAAKSSQPGTEPNNKV